MGGDTRQLPGDIKMFYILMAVISQESTKTHQIIYFKCVNFIIGKSHFKKVDLKIIRPSESSPNHLTSLCHDFCKCGRCPA